MATYVTKEALKDALSEFRARADERWALKDEVVTEEMVAEMIDGLSSLTEEDVTEVLSTL